LGRKNSTETRPTSNDAAAREAKESLNWTCPRFLSQGSFVFVKRVKDDATTHNIDFLQSLERVAAHELLHTIMNEPGGPDAEHVFDGNEDGIEHSNVDRAFLMYEEAAENPLHTFISQVTNRRIDLTNKQSVER